jgi:murein tripeptide amidase MpaA
MFDLIKPASMKRSRITLLMILFSVYCSGQDPGWLTPYEKSGKRETPRYPETVEFCKRLADASPLVTLVSFGTTSRGRDLEMLIVDGNGSSDPISMRESGKLLVLIQACIHPGECEGKDAGLMLIRDIVIDRKFPELLDHVSILFIPIFNADGHERFGPANRINQNGPEETGWRVTANNLNLNRDFLKADAPEMQAWLKMFHYWMPDFFIDTHTTDGADYQYVLTYLMEISGSMDEGLTEWSVNSFLKPMASGMERLGIPVTRYVELRNWNDLKSGLVYDVSPPMLSQAYTSLLNRPGLLIETHMLKPYDQRVGATYECIRISLGILNREFRNLKERIRQADDYASGREFREKPFPLKFETLMNDSVILDFKGIGFELVQSKVTGEPYYHYTGEERTFPLPLFGNVQPARFTRLPEAYIVPVEWKAVIDRLEMHGIRFYKLKHDTTLRISTWKLSEPKWQQNPYEGRHSLTSFQATEMFIEKTFPAGSAVVDLAQPSVRVIAHMLEPFGNGSLLSWGFFDAVFEQKEYAERYVLEPMAAKMLEENPELRKEFEQKKQEDSIFASNGYLILRWFYNKSPYWDNVKDIYPVGKITDRQILEGLIRDP